MRTRLSVCIKKARYSSEDEAKIFAERVGLDLRPYRCERCRRIHLTSRLKGKRVRRPTL